MPLSQHHSAIQQLHAACMAQPLTQPVQKLFSQGLQHLLKNVPMFDECVGEDNPFYQEFVCHLNGSCLDEDGLSLFECLTIFFRLRQMHTKETALGAVERRVLHYFETCGEWQPHDATIVSFWYWWRIPLQVAP